MRRMEQKAAFVRSDNMFPDIDKQTLRRNALAAMQAEVIPHHSPLHIWGGSGSGQKCPICSQLIDPADVELELEFAPAGLEDSSRELHLHLPCFAAWELVRTSHASMED